MNFSSRLRAPLHLSFSLFYAAALGWSAENSYLAPGQPDGTVLLAPPPVPGSAEEAADLASVRSVFKAKTAAETARATMDSGLSFNLFAPAIGTVFNLAKLPKTQALLEKVKKDLQDPINKSKDHFKRKRPYQMDPELNLGAPEPSFSYPSGHSTRGTVYALVLAELFPEHKEAILAVGRDIGWDRVVIGKHFPTDIYAGRVLGQAILRELLLNPAFRQDLAAARSEIANAGPKAAALELVK